jgi:hypothetical protein
VSVDIIDELALMQRVCSIAVRQGERSAASQADQALGEPGARDRRLQRTKTLVRAAFIG